MMKLKTIMQEKNITPKELSIKSRVAISFINYIISGKKSPTVRTLEKNCKSLRRSNRSLIKISQIAS